MALDNFIPVLWSARLLSNLQRTLVYGQTGVINRDFEGEITAAGDSVKINNMGRVSVGDYTKNQDMDSAETLDSSSRTLLIDQSKYFNFQIDDVDKIQQNPKLMDAAMQEAAYALKNTADSYIASHYVDAAHTIGSDTKVVSPTKNDAYEYLVDLSVKLDEADVPEQGRWVVVTPWYEGLMLKDDRFVKAGNMSSEQRLLNGVIGQAAGFTVLKSNNAPLSKPEGGTENHKIIAGHGMAWSYADQATQVEAYRPEKRFADAVKGLHLYGAKVTRPEALAVLSAARPQ
ncbi:P22 phage major capsid protein family protein [Bacillus velezensis]|uniref:phage capsid protein n=1 Tax=Bacillus amyloliquefaciens group TaxID=1938374 RepID=UPI0006A8A454|nr:MULTISPECIES: phage capsid protein [Bacillus amyloliquefaciens group]MDV2630125.1 P22 phage major capsid protein family protein [Bacillus velezensis]MDX7896358.1 P22 phage major capsid protein family protein [Bacillus velezensis]MDX8026876.1 P22 phage major capsid protein family protein [Bacillus velezensis]MDX8200096.1 P22 phage major capsid protein family protein [Bacillus velezensis]MDX8226302.1 P22 phage major capsid protein family protein [Bacillus velezensis]